MRHSTGRRVGRTFGWVAVAVVSVLALGAGLLAGAAIALIEAQR
jgi:hypothetical protein